MTNGDRTANIWLEKRYRNDNDLQCMTLVISKIVLIIEFSIVHFYHDAFELRTFKGLYITDTCPINC